MNQTDSIVTVVADTLNTVSTPTSTPAPPATPVEAHSAPAVPKISSRPTTTATPVASADAPMANTAPASVKIQPVVADSIAGDSIKASGTKTFGVVLDAPEVPVVEKNNNNSFGMSCILAGLFLLFCIIGLRFRNNSKYIGALLRNLVEVRVRSNVFDETVRETSFIVLLNILWSCSAGLVLCALLDWSLPTDPAASFGIVALMTKPALCTAICMGVMIIYTCGMALAYMSVGTVFSDGVHARIWLKGFLASQGLLGVVYFPLSLLLLYYPEWSQPLLLTALVTFLMAKIVFIWKGFRIFFTQFSSWVLFLYYLCSLEIVPLVLTYWAACLLCSLL